MKRTPGLLLTIVLGVAGCQLAGTPLGQEAPAACGFPDGTALSYAGRSTTAALHVQEVVGDPLSDDPADIYITRDKFDQGVLHGRLVCAIFVGNSGFVEITVHPADGGRFSGEEPSPPGSNAPAGSPESGLSEDEAVELARAAAPQSAHFPVTVAKAGPASAFSPFHDIAGDRWVWYILLSDLGPLSGEGTMVFLDFVDGRVYEVIDVIG